VRPQADRPAFAPVDCSARTTHVPRCDSSSLSRTSQGPRRATPIRETDPSTCTDPWAKREAWRKVGPPRSFLPGLPRPERTDPALPAGYSTPSSPTRPCLSLFPSPPQHQGRNAHSPGNSHSRRRRGLELTSLLPSCLSGDDTQTVRFRNLFPGFGLGLAAFVAYVAYDETLNAAKKEHH
jgi:hypothetical protein